MQFFTQFGYLSYFWPNFNIFGIKKYVLELRNSLVILSHYLINSLTQYHAIKLQYSCILAISAIYDLISTYYISRSCTYTHYCNIDTFTYSSTHFHANYIHILDNLKLLQLIFNDIFHTTHEVCLIGVLQFFLLECSPRGLYTTFSLSYSHLVSLRVSV